MTGGVSLGTLLQHHRMHMFATERATEKEAATDGQSLLVAFFFSCFGPFVYQALLETSIAIAQPFSNSDAVVPTKRILNVLEKDLHDAERMAKEKKKMWQKDAASRSEKKNGPQGDDVLAAQGEGDEGE